MTNIASFTMATKATANTASFHKRLVALEEQVEKMQERLPNIPLNTAPEALESPLKLHPAYLVATVLIAVSVPLIDIVYAFMPSYDAFYVCASQTAWPLSYSAMFVARRLSAEQTDSRWKTLMMDSFFMFVLAFPTLIDCIIGRFGVLPYVVFALFCFLLLYLDKLLLQGLRDQDFSEKQWGDYNVTVLVTAATSTFPLLYIMIPCVECLIESEATTKHEADEACGKTLMSSMYLDLFLIIIIFQRISLFPLIRERVSQDFTVSKLAVLQLRKRYMFNIAVVFVTACVGLFYLTHLDADQTGRATSFMTYLGLVGLFGLLGIIFLETRAYLKHESRKRRTLLAMGSTKVKLEGKRSFDLRTQEETQKTVAKDTLTIAMAGFAEEGLERTFNN